jgi:hypothetical protein
MAAKPPTITKSISASHRRCNKRLISFTELFADSFQFERQVQRLLVLDRALLDRLASIKLRSTPARSASRMAVEAFPMRNKIPKKNGR